MNRMPIMKEQCATCPFRKGVAEKYREVMAPTMDMVMNEASRICHCTGKNNAFHQDTGKPERLCRGARNFQLNVLTAIGFLEAATDAAWDKKCAEMGIHPDTMQ